MLGNGLSRPENGISRHVWTLSESTDSGAATDGAHRKPDSEPFLLQLAPTDEPSIGVLQFPPVQLHLPTTEYRLQNAGLWHAGLIAAYFRHQEMLFLVARLYRSPFTLLQFFWINRVHRARLAGYTQLRPASGSSFCEWKGSAQYWSPAEAPDRAPIGWSYPHPNTTFAAIENWLCFYPSRVSCFVNGQAARAQASEFYGGWITDEIIGPFKGDPGTGHW